MTMKFMMTDFIKGLQKDFIQLTNHKLNEHKHVYKTAGSSSSTASSQKKSSNYINRNNPAPLHSGDIPVLLAAAAIPTLL